MLIKYFSSIKEIVNYQTKWQVGLLQCNPNPIGCLPATGAKSKRPFLMNPFSLTWTVFERGKDLWTDFYHKKRNGSFVNLFEKGSHIVSQDISCHQEICEPIFAWTLLFVVSFFTKGSWLWSFLWADFLWSFCSRHQNLWPDFVNRFRSAGLVHSIWVLLWQIPAPGNPSRWLSKELAMAASQLAGWMAPGAAEWRRKHPKLPISSWHAGHGRKGNRVSVLRTTMHNGQMMMIWWLTCWGWLQRQRQNAKKHFQVEFHTFQAVSDMHHVWPVCKWKNAVGMTHRCIMILHCSFCELLCATASMQWTHKLAGHEVDCFTSLLQWSILFWTTVVV